MTNLTHHGRYGYSPITDRADFTWPGGARLAVYVAVNVEWFSFGEGPGATLDGAKPAPDVQNYSWRDYGNRVGIFRLLRLLDELGWTASMMVNSCLYDEAPAIMETIRAGGHEIVAHGTTNSVKPGELAEAAERQVIREARDRIAREEGAPPAGWLAPWISESRITPDLLAEAGYAYLLDWCHDDQPVWMKTRAGPILSVPYPQELNDIPQIVGRNRDGAEFGQMIRDAFDVHRHDPWPGVMGIALHPYLVGQPHRFETLRATLHSLKSMGGDSVWFTTAGDIADHYRKAFPA